MSAIEILAVVGIIGYVIYKQIQGEALRGKRAVLLPAILTVIGYLNLSSGSARLSSADITWIAIGAAGSAAIGIAFGAITRLESRGGYLWAKLPLAGLWLWAALIGWRVLIMVVASGMHAHVAASTSTLLLTLGINRLAQAAVIVPRAMAMGVPFAPEKDGKVFMGDTFNRGLGDRNFADRNAADRDAADRDYGYRDRGLSNNDHNRDRDWRQQHGHGRQDWS